MKRLFVVAVAGCMTIGLIASASAAKKNTLKVPRLGKQVPATPVSRRVPATPNQDLEPVPEAPGGPIDTALVPWTNHPVPATAKVPLEPNYTPVEHVDEAIPMFENVRYVGRRRMAPCAESKVIVIRDPCQPLLTSPCCRKCVAIRICVPTCGCECIKASRLGNRVRYDYGEYAVDVRITRGRVVVAYRD